MALPVPMVGAPITATGGIAYAPISSSVTLPTDATAQLGSGFVTVGLVDEEGVKFNEEHSTEDKREWGGNVVRTVETDFKATLAFNLLESTKAEVLKLVYGDENVTITAGKVTVKHKAGLPPRRAFAITIKDGEKLRRFVVPNGQIAVSGEISLVRNDIIKYACTVTAFADETGVPVYDYVDEPVTASDDE